DKLVTGVQTCALPISEKTPVGALTLHSLSCFILIFATYGMTPDDAYSLLTSLAAYLLNSVFGTFLGLGILILRLTPRYGWKDKRSEERRVGKECRCRW